MKQDVQMSHPSCREGSSEGGGLEERVPAISSLDQDCCPNTDPPQRILPFYSEASFLEGHKVAFLRQTLSPKEAQKVALLGLERWLRWLRG